jgi:pimeloyl-ACP methyl ester carboxylesterase/putative sterol carrier protein
MLERLLGRSVRARSSSMKDALDRELRAHVTALFRAPHLPDGTLTFDAGKIGAWTVKIRGGVVSLLQGRVRRPTSLVSADPQTILDVVSGRTPGAEAFLERRLFLRGNIAFALELDGWVQKSSRAPRARRVDVDGVRTFFLEAGPRDAPPVILFHGLGATSSSFLPTLWDFGRDHRVIAPDLPGFGETDKPLRALHAQFFAQWAVGLLDALGIARADLVGNSMGGRLAIEVALSAPERVEKIALLAPSLAWRKFRHASPLVRLLRPELAALPLPVLHRGVLTVLRAMFAKPDRVADAAMNAAADEFLRAFSTARGRIAFFHALREIYLDEATGDRGLWDRLPKLERPALFLFGDKDRLVPARFASHVRRALPDAEIEVMHDCGHVPQFEHPRATHERMRRFFGRLATMAA